MVASGPSDGCLALCGWSVGTIAIPYFAAIYAKILRRPNLDGGDPKHGLACGCREPARLEYSIVPLSRDFPDSGYLPHVARQTGTRPNCGPLAATSAADPRLRRLLRTDWRPEAARLRARSPATLSRHPAGMSPHPHLFTGSGRVTEDDPDTCDMLHVVGWPDPVIDALGHDPRSWYVEQFWLSVLGPTSTWLMRRLAAGLDAAPGGLRPPRVRNRSGSRPRWPRRTTFAFPSRHLQVRHLPARPSRGSRNLGSQAQGASSATPACSSSARITPADAPGLVRLEASRRERPGPGRRSDPAVATCRNRSVILVSRV
jgi:hypothetical protein